MILSMTGYGAAQGESQGLRLSVELKSVNNRFLDVSFRLAEVFTALETALRGKIAARLARGKVECRLFFARANGGKKGFLNEAALSELGELETQVRAVLPDAKPFSVAALVLEIISLSFSIPSRVWFFLAKLKMLLSKPPKSAETSGSPEPSSNPSSSPPKPSSDIPASLIIPLP